MTVQLSYAGVTIALPNDIQWVDEFDWSPVGQSAERGITGALIVQSRAMTAGRPVTLEPDGDNSAWMPRSTVEQLRNAAAIPGQVMTLTMNSQIFSVIFRHQDGSPVEAKPVATYSDYTLQDHYLVKVKLMTV